MEKIYGNYMKKNHTYKKQRMTRKKTRKVRGGKAIGSGGFGCVFRPAIKCKKRNKKIESKKYVSKVMTPKHAKSEYNIIKKVEKVLDKVPNYQQYFLVDDIHKCKPGPLSEEDKINFDKKCKPLRKHDNLTSKNVNENLFKIEQLVMPNGGVTLDTYYKNMESLDNLIYINTQLIELLYDGILPMNELSMYHADLKESNILYNIDTYKLAIIDWGLAFKYKRGKIPNIIRNKPFQYNLPFSVILFNSKFEERYQRFMKDEFLKKTGSYVIDLDNQESMSMLWSFIGEYINYHNEWRGPGHYDLIKTIWDDYSPSGDAIDIIILYLLSILMVYTNEKNGNFESQLYFQDVFLKNIDIWGLLMCYISVMEEDYFDKKNAVYELLKKHCLMTGPKSINIIELRDDMNRLF